MVIAALISFAVLLIAWIAAPSGATRAEEMPMTMQPEALAEAA